MAIVDVVLSVHDVHLLSEHVEITEHSARSGAPVFQGDVFRLDFAFVRVGFDLYRIMKERKPLPVQDTSPTNPHHRMIHGSRAIVRTPTDDWWF